MKKNVMTGERILSIAAGGAMIGYGIRRASIPGAALAIAGVLLVKRGFTGYCELYDTLGLSSKKPDSVIARVRHDHGIRVQKSVIVSHGRREMYHFWRDFQNLPRFMRHLKSVQLLDGNRSHWVAKAPGGTAVEWDAEIYNQQEPDFIAWRSLENADINHAGSVHFLDHDSGSTEIRVELNYEPPMGKTFGEIVSRFISEEPGKQIQEDLQNLKNLIESGEIVRL
jgi:uncharacterized membrane protein